MSKEAMKLALEALKNFEKAGLATLKTIDAITALKQALEQPEPEPVAWAISFDGETPYTLWDGGDCALLDIEVQRHGGKARKMPLYTSPPETAELLREIAELSANALDDYKMIQSLMAEREPEPDRKAFERYWKKTRGEKKSDRELKRHPLQPQVYIQDSANRHWVTWQAATKKASTPKREQEPVAWRNAAMRVGEDLCSVGPFGYYDMTAEQWLDWALSVVTVHAPPPKREPPCKTGSQCITKCMECAEPEPVIDKSAAIRIATSLGWTPQRKPLTDEEIIQIASTPNGSQATTKGYVIPFARAIEAAHGIKGEA